MRMLKIPELPYEQYREITDKILEIIPFALINAEYSKELKAGFFYFWDVLYIPECLREYMFIPPKTHENVEKLHKAIESVLL